MSSLVFGMSEEEVVYQLSSTLHSYILDILGYGMYTSVYFVALYLTLSRGSDKPRLGSAVLITTMWILVTIHAGITWAYLDNTFIRHGETRETQIESHFLSRFGESFAQRVVEMIVTFASLLLADITMIWRCWVLYGQRWFIVVVPAVSLVAGSACYIWRTVLLFRLRGPWSTNQISNLELIFLSTTVLTNIFCTSTITARIIGVSGWRKSLKTYRRLMEILIESSILYTAIYVIRIGLQIYAQYLTEKLDERTYYPQALGYSITGIAPTLVIARVAAGFARPDDSWSRTSLPHIRSTMRSLAESLHFAQPATGTVAETVDLERSPRREDEEAELHVEDNSRSARLQRSPEEGEKKGGQMSFQEV